MSRLFKNLSAAVDAILPTAKKPAPSPETAAVPPEEPKPKGVLVPELLFAWKASQKNPRLLTAYKPGTDPTNPTNLVTVNVRNNVNFLPHMRLKVSRVSATVFDLVGPLPRWRGKY